MKTITTKCIILGHKDFGEFDKIVYLYNEKLGKIRVIAKGAKKITSKFTGHLETLNFCTASLYFGPKNIILTEISTDKTYFKSRKSFSTLASALRLTEITNQMLYENQKLDNLSRLIQKSIKHISTSKKPELISIAYIIKLMDKMGLIPDFKQTDLKLETKYLKFFNFIKNEKLSEIEKIILTKKEKNKIKEFTKELVQKEIHKTLSDF